MLAAAEASCSNPFIQALLRDVGGGAEPAADNNGRDSSHVPRYHMRLSAELLRRSMSSADWPSGGDVAQQQAGPLPTVADAYNSRPPRRPSPPPGMDGRGGGWPQPALPARQHQLGAAGGDGSEPPLQAESDLIYLPRAAARPQTAGNAGRAGTQESSQSPRGPPAAASFGGASAATFSGWNAPPRASPGSRPSPQRPRSSPPSRTQPHASPHSACKASPGGHKGTSSPAGKPWSPPRWNSSPKLTNQGPLGSAVPDAWSRRSYGAREEAHAYAPAVARRAAAGPRPKAGQSPKAWAGDFGHLQQGAKRFTKETAFQHHQW